MEKKNRKKNANDLSIESQTLPQRLIEDRILMIRGVQVIIDKDLAAL